MKNSLLTALLLTMSAIVVTGQAPLSADKKNIIFLCPPCGIYCDTIHFHEPGYCPVCAMKLFASYPEYENTEGEHFDVVNKKVAVVLFPGVEIIDFSGPWEVFGASGMDVFSVAATDAIINAGMGLKIKPDYSFSNAPAPDIILVPGGNVDPSDTLLVNWIRNMSQNAEYTMSVCTGAFYLAAGGLLDNLKATTNYPAIQALRGMSPTTTVMDNVRFVDNGRIITSAGLSSGIDAALHLVSIYLGEAQTKKLANELEYNWDNEDPFIRSKLADKYVQDFLNAFIPFDYKMTNYAGDRNQWQVSLDVKVALSKAEFSQLLAFQLEQVAGWKKSKKPNLWTFTDQGKKWSARLDQVQRGNDEFLITLQVF